MLYQNQQQKQNNHNVELYEYTLRNEHLEVRFLNIGGVITKIALAEDEYNENLVLTYDNLDTYFNNNTYIGTLVGRTSNRIKNGQFPLNGETIQLDLNDGPNNLHGGVQCLTHTLLDVKPTDNGYCLTTTLPHQEQGFPGNLAITVHYTLDKNQLHLNYEATTDQDTIVNLTQHTYFNLSGNLKTNIYNHLVQIKSDAIAEVDENLSFTTKEIPVINTRFDFNELNRIDPEKDKPEHPLFDRAGGYDHLFLLNDGHEAATFKDPESGRTLTVSTTSPSLQFYAGNFLTNENTFEHGRSGEIHLGACFETHLVPYDYESQLLKPGETYKQSTAFTFTK